MRTTAPDLLPIFRSELQARVLALLLMSDRDWTTRELADSTGAARSALHRELGRLTQAGILERRGSGRRLAFRAAEDSPIYRPLRELVERTLGVEPELRRRLESLDGVRAAALFGSWPAGRPGQYGDIDLLVVGDADLGAVVAEAKAVERQAGREIDVVLYSVEEWRRQLRQNTGFVRSVNERAITPLVGRVFGPQAP